MEIDITEYKELPDKVNNSVVEYEQLIEDANAPIVGVDEYLNINEWNSNIERLTGYLKSDVMNKSIINIILPEYKEDVQRILKRALSGDETSNYLLPFRTTDNKMIELLINSTSRKDFNGNIIGVIGIGQDLTLFREANKFKENSLVEYEQLVEGANAPIVGVDEYLNINEWNSNIERLTGYSKSDVMNQSIINIILPEHKEDVEKILKRALSGDETSNYQLPFKTTDNKMIELLINSTSRKDFNGNIIGVIGIGQDLTLFREANKFKENSLVEYEQLVEGANAPIVGVDEYLNINEWNSNIERLTGYSKSDVMNQSIINIILPEHKEDVEKILKRALSGDETSNYQLPFKTTDNKMIELLINSTSRKDFDGNIIGVIGIGQDLTQLKEEISSKNKSEYELELYQKVISSVMHEVRNPLNVTYQIFDLLKTDLETISNSISKLFINNDEYVILTNTISDMLNNVNIGIQCSEQKLKVLNGILSMTQLEQGKLKLKSDRVNLFDLCNIQCNMIKKTAMNEVKVNLICRENLNVMSDDKHLSQILTNILSNAVKITEKGSITLHVKVLNELDNYLDIQFNIIDTGPGMSNELQNKILEAKRFEHGGFKHGSGIGLCIVIEILKLMNTKLEITSPYNISENNGTNFNFKIRLKNIMK